VCVCVCVCVYIYKKSNTHTHTHTQVQYLLEQPWRILDELRARGLTPDATTYGSLLAVCTRAGTWQRALELQQEILQANIEMQRPLYNALIDAVWEHNAQAALEIFRRAIETHYANVFTIKADDGRIEWTLDLRRLSGSAAQAALVWWIQEHLQTTSLVDRPPHKMVIITGWGKVRAPWQTSYVPHKVTELLVGIDAPTIESDVVGRVQLDVAKLQQWAPHALLCAQSQSWRLRA